MIELQRGVLSTVQKLVSTFFWQVSCVMEKAISAHQHHTFRSSDPLHLLHNQVYSRGLHGFCEATGNIQRHRCSSGDDLTANLKLRSDELKISHVFEPAQGYFQTKQSCLSRFFKSVGSFSLTQNPLAKASCISFWHCQKCRFWQKLSKWNR